jgi:hypothetical protein
MSHCTFADRSSRIDVGPISPTRFLTLQHSFYDLDLAASDFFCSCRNTRDILHPIECFLSANQRSGSWFSGIILP